MWKKKKKNEQLNTFLFIFSIKVTSNRVLENTV